MLPYRVGPRQRQSGRDEFDKTVKDNVAKVATTRWASHIVLVPTEIGSLWLCDRYPKENVANIRDNYLIPRMKECMYSAGAANVFSALDANSGYWQNEMDKKDIDQTAFVTHNNLYRYM